MEAAAAIPWPDQTAARPIAAVVVRPTRRSSPLVFWTGVVVLLTFSQGWAVFLTGPNGDPSTSGLVRTLFLPVYALAIGLAAVRPRAALAAVVATPLLWLLIGVVLASILWSVAPDITERRGIALLFTTLAGLALASRFDWDELAEVFATTFATLAVLSLLLAVLLPSWGRMTELFPGAWRGVWNEKNALGDHMAQGVMVFAAAAVLNPARRWLWVLFALLAVALIVMSQSKTSLVSVALGLAMLAFVAITRRGRMIAVVMSLLAVVAGTAFVLGVVFAGDQMIRLLGKDPTLTGRTFIWAAVMNRIQERPLFGWGYVAVWDDLDRWAPLAKIVKQIHFRPHHAHNSWLEIWLDLGVVGLAAWAAYLGEAVIRSVVSIYRGRGPWLAAPFLMVYLFQSLTETIFFIYNDFIWVIFVAVATRLALPAGFGGRPVEADAP